jgi:hypothetical protein
MSEASPGRHAGLRNCRDPARLYPFGSALTKSPFGLSFPLAGPSGAVEAASVEQVRKSRSRSLNVNCQK